jgi:hypothetical protein
MTDVYTSNISRSSVTPGCRTVVHSVIPSTSGDYLVPIPFRGRLVHAQTCVQVVIGATNDITLGLEKDAAGGTLMGSATISADDAVGTENLVVLTAGLSSDDLTVENQDVCLAVTGTQATGMVNVYLIFESAVGQ